MSVGLGKIINDPTASIRTRKALGRLSTPGLLVTDQGLTIDDDGRMALRVKPSAGLTEDATGLSAVLKPSAGLAATATGLSAVLKPSAGLAVDATGLSVLLKSGGNISVDANGLSVAAPTAAYSPPWTRFLTATATFALNLIDNASDYTLTVSGAVVGDCVIVSPTSTPNIACGSWSGLVSAANTVRIRIRIGYSDAATPSQEFHVTVIGF